MDSKEEAINELLDLSSKKGYITADDIMDVSDDYALTFQETDWVSEILVSRNVIIYDDERQAANQKTSDEYDEYEDYSQSDYEAVYERIIELDNSLEPFIEKTRNIKPPQRGEFDSLKYLAVEGNEHARQRIIEMYLRVAIKMALQGVETYGTEISESIADAYVGLAEAVDKYDPDMSGSFQGYASLSIMRSLKILQDANSPLVSYPAYIKDVVSSIFPLLRREGFPLEISELPEDILIILKEERGLNDKQIKKVLLAGFPTESFDQLVDEGRLVELHEVSFEDPVFDYYCQKAIREKIDAVLKTLTYRERGMLSLYFGLDDDIDRTCEEVGKYYLLSRTRVQQIIAKALRKLHHPSRSRKFKDFL